MATKKKLLQAAAGTAAASGGAGGLNVEDVFSTYLYEGNGSSQVIENGINLGQSFGSGSISVPRGEDNNVTTSTNSDFAYGTGDFTWEAWIMPQVDDGTLNNTNRYIFDHGSGNLGSMSYYNGVLRYYNSTTNPQDSSQALTNYTWAHIAACRSSGTTKVFYNGTQILSFSDSHNFTATSFVIGDYGGSGGTYSFGGLYSDVRISKTARYTSNFTVPSSSFSSDSNTVLLTGQGSTIVDNSSNALTLTANGDAVGKSFGYYDAAEAGEGGLVWIKNRDDTGSNHVLFDTERPLISGDIAKIYSNLTNGQDANADDFEAFNANGFSLNGTYNVNSSSYDYASWTFRKAPKFFDVVKVVGDGTGTRTINHNLNGTVGTIIIKKTSGTGNWVISHRTQNNFVGWGKLNTTDAFSSTGSQISNVTDTSFDIGSFYNGTGVEWIIYVFAHNDGDGEFGPDGDQDVIKAGAFTKTDTGGTNFIEVNLGFEVQWLLVKATSESGNWEIWDVQRGLSYNGAKLLNANSSSAESSYPTVIRPTPNGFEYSDNNATSYIYIAIRRGPMAVPTDATDVFDVEYSSQNSDGYYANLGAVTDTWLYKDKSTSSNWLMRSRLTGANYLNTNLTNAETSQSVSFWDNMNGVGPTGSTASTNTNRYSWVWKRAPNYFDVVAYTGNGTAGRTVSHNLGVAPEMMWVKSRTGSTGRWAVYHKDLGNTDYLFLNEADAAGTFNAWNDTTPTDSVFSLSSWSTVNDASRTYIAYLFASLDGVSKVGSYTGTGAAQNIDCGFSSGARFVLIKCSSHTGNWRILDTTRGIVAGNDAQLYLDLTDAEYSGEDVVDPYSSGFSVTTGTGNVNVSGRTYIFYAIA